MQHSPTIAVLQLPSCNLAVVSVLCASNRACIPLQPTPPARRHVRPLPLLDPPPSWPLSKIANFLRRVGFCGLLFLFANVLKKLLAKLFSSHFYKATHYDKMQDALRKEFFIVALSQPREDREEDDPMKHKPSALADLRTKSFAAGGALVSLRASSSPCSVLLVAPFHVFILVPILCRWLFCESPLLFFFNFSAAHGTLVSAPFLIFSLFCGCWWCPCKCLCLFLPLWARQMWQL